MPKTIEDLEIELAQMKGELIAKQKQLDTKISQEAHAIEQLTASQEELKSYQTKEREGLITEIHSVDPKFEIKDLSLGELHAMVKGIHISHSVGTPTKGVNPPSSTVSKNGKRLTELELAFNA